MILVLRKNKALFLIIIIVFMNIVKNELVRH